jgi:hypothetical protein
MTPPENYGEEGGVPHIAAGVAVRVTQVISPIFLQGFFSVKPHNGGIGPGGILPPPGETGRMAPCGKPGRSMSMLRKTVMDVLRRCRDWSVKNEKMKGEETWNGGVTEGNVLRERDGNGSLWSFSPVVSSERV